MKKPYYNEYDRALMRLNTTITGNSMLFNLVKLRVYRKLGKIYSQVKKKAKNWLLFSVYFVTIVTFQYNK